MGEHCTGNSLEVMGLNPVKARIFSRNYFTAGYRVHNCDDY